MQMDSADTASQIVFAGIRFTLAGLLVLAFASIREKKVMFPNKEILKYAIPVCEYYGAAEPPVRCGESHLSGLTEPSHFVY